jgi:hypothetical protein
MRSWRATCHVHLDAPLVAASETYGHQQGSAYNGYFACTCYHPLFLFNQFGDLERVLLRRGNHPSAKFWRRVLLPVVERYRDRDIPKCFRGDSAFALPKLLRLLEQEGFRYAIRLKANPVLERKIAHLLKRPVRRPSRKPTEFYASVRYRAGSWDQARRVVAKVEWHAGELFPRVGFIVTNLKWASKRVVRFYNRRGTAEQWIKEGKNAVKWTKLSCRRFKDNAARLQLFALAYNLGNFLRQLVLPKPIRGWTLTTLREKLIKIGAKVVRHSKYVLFQLGEVAVPRKLFARILGGSPACAPPVPRVEVGPLRQPSPRAVAGRLRCAARGDFEVLRGREEPAAATPGLGQTRSGVHPGGKFVAPDPSPEYDGLEDAKPWSRKASIWERSDHAGRRPGRPGPGGPT